MHVLVLPSWYASEANPNDGCFFAEQAEALARAGHTVSVFPLYNDDKVRPAAAPARRGSFTEYPIHYRPVRFHLTYFRILGEMFRIMRTELRGKKPDIIHVHSFRAIKYARVLKAVFKIPMVVTEHVTWFERGGLSEKQLKSIARDYAAADAIVAVSTGLREQIRPYCGDKEIHVIPNIVSGRFYEGAFHTPPGERFGFISVGMLHPKKGLDILLRAFARVAEKENVTLTICGDGDERGALESLAEELGIKESVTFAGIVSREEVARRLRENQIFVLPSRTETFGVVYVEAMACGLPIIMTKTNAWEMLATPETGVAVEIEDTVALAEAMGHVLRHYREYDPERIRQYCLDHFSETAVTGQLTALYKSVLRISEDC